MNKRISKLVFFVTVLLLTGASCIKTSGTGNTAMGMYRSDDKGDSWKQISALPTPKGVQSIAGVRVYRIFTDPSDPDAMYLGTRGQGMYYSYNNGDSWQAAEALNGKFIYSVAVDPKDKCTLYVTDGGNIYKSTDCSRTWKSVFVESLPAELIKAVAVDYGNPQTLYAALQGGDVLLSSDGGASWQTIKRLPFQIEYLTSDPKAPRRIYVAGAADGLVRSDDGGVTWKDLRQPLEKYTDNKIFNRLILHPSKPNTIFWISKYGILRSDDAGANWQELRLITPPGTVNIYGFGINPLNENELYYTGTILGEKNAHVRSTFYKSVDGGKSWTTKKLPTNTIPVAIYIHPLKPEMVFMAFTLVN